MIPASSESKPLEIDEQREHFNLEIRKQHREEVFSKRRHVESPAASQRLNEKYRQLEGCPLIAEYIEFNKAPANPSLLSHFIECVTGVEASRVLFGLMGIRKLLADGSECFQQVVDSGVVHHIIAIARDYLDPCFKIEAAWCIANLASGTTEQCQCLVNKGAIPVVVDLFDSPYSTVIQQAIWAVANIGGDNSENRDEMISYGVLQRLVGIVDSSSQEFIRLRCLWAIANLCRGKPPPKFLHVRQAVRFMCKVLREKYFDNDDEVHVHIASALHLHCNSKFDRIQFFIDELIVPRLVDFLAESNDALVLLCLKILGYFVTGNVMQTATVINAGILPYLEMLVCNESVVIKREAAWILSNLAASDQPTAERIVFNEHTCGKLLEMLEFDPEVVQKEIVWIFNHASDQCNSEEFMRMVQDTGFVRHLVRMLDSLDTGIVECSLQTIERLLQLGGGDRQRNPMITQLNSYYGIEKLEQLQTHASPRIYKMVLKMLSNHFDLEQPTI